MDVNVLAVGLGAVLTVVVGGAYYAVAGSAAVPERARGRAGAPSGVTVLGTELLRGVVLTAGVAVLVAATATTGLVDGLLLGTLLWVAFPVVLLAGAVVHEGVRPTLAAVHAGDWLVKLLVVSALLAVWR
ncbi:DUF1761 domain-containing protein [Thalassiella azotivora]